MQGNAFLELCPILLINPTYLSGKQIIVKVKIKMLHELRHIKLEAAAAAD